MVFTSIVSSHLTCRVVDWDGVGLIPLKLAALTLKERFYRVFFLSFNVSFSDFHVRHAERFDEEIRRFETRRPWSHNLTLSTPLEGPDHENLILSLLYHGVSLPELRSMFPQVVEEILTFSKEILLPLLWSGTILRLNSIQISVARFRTGPPISIFRSHLVLLGKGNLMWHIGGLGSLHK